MTVQDFLAELCEAAGFNTSGAALMPDEGWELRKELLCKVKALFQRGDAAFKQRDEYAAQAAEAEKQAQQMVEQYEARIKELEKMLAEARNSASLQWDCLAAVNRALGLAGVHFLPEDYTAAIKGLTAQVAEVKRESTEPRVDQSTKADIRAAIRGAMPVTRVDMVKWFRTMAEFHRDIFRGELRELADDIENGKE